ncbi:hypothetical protein DS909_17700 [Phaeobacter gallaeciensis]|uniref:Uncharacterized protein n=2 Tax=Roseobacteraceae TaxID=2854170 RepID=A0A366WUM5_9RHOB|nr:MULTISPECIES: hypothetical protein [Roseobacteraceae]MBT3140350.1 hypothetical protein [Falsiruegeria litorea]MBT8169209.1 hypothetical protein [Falsiruegeria litorea]RBW51762.1 hypothetical protein DS909_17700 [Phaeobacter gallaeciensis]
MKLFLHLILSACLFFSFHPSLLRAEFGPLKFPVTFLKMCSFFEGKGGIGKAKVVCRSERLFGSTAIDGRLAIERMDVGEEFEPKFWGEVARVDGLPQPLIGLIEDIKHCKRSKECDEKFMSSDLFNMLGKVDETTIVWKSHYLTYFWSGSLSSFSEGPIAYLVEVDSVFVVFVSNLVGGWNILDDVSFDYFILEVN